MNFRIDEASAILKTLDYNTILDVGCRRCDLKRSIENSKNYFGCDLFQNDDNLVSYVGDIMTLEINKQFDVVVALDIVEHVDNPYDLMDKLFSLSSKYIIISLPNIYDMKHKYNFLFKSSLGGKYTFNTTNSLDRHRWLMNYDEIHNFYKYYADKHDTKLITTDIKFGSTKGSSTINKTITSIIEILGFYKTTTRTVMGVFEKK